MYRELKAIIEDQLQVMALGYLPDMKECSLESRHLGLVTAAEVKNLKAITDSLGEQVLETVDLEG